MKKEFPTKLHFIWWQGAHCLPEAFARNLAEWRGFNPEYDVIVWDEPQFMHWLGREFPEDVRAFTRIPSEPRANGTFPDIRKADAARFFLLARLGGAYFDLDLVPQKPIRAFLDDTGIVLRDHPNHFHRIDRQHLEKRHYLSLRSRDSIVFLDTQVVDARGPAILNGALFARPHDQSWMLDFVRKQMARVSLCRWAWRQPLPALECFGSHALAEYVRTHAPTLQNKLFTCPGQYVIWDDKVFGERRWWFVLCMHDGSTGGQSWGMHHQRGSLPMPVPSR